MVMDNSSKNFNKMKSDYLDNMSHDIRTPLNVIVGLSQLLIDDDKPLNEIKVREDLLKINNAGEILLDILNDILDNSKNAIGKLELNQAEYNTANFLRSIVSLNMMRIENIPISFNVTVSNQIPCLLYGDEERIKQLFNKLINCVFKQIKKGTVSLSVGIEPVNEKAIYITAGISGQGIDINPDDLSLKLAEMMQGEIVLEKPQGTDNSIRVRIRQDVIDKKPIGKDVAANIKNFSLKNQKSSLAPKNEVPDPSNKTVLVVDDFLTNLDVTAGILSKYKLKVDCITSGKKAVELVKNGEPVYDAIFMDHMMPEMDGMEATKWIRGFSSEYAKTVPIIALTANVSVECEQMYLDNGFTAFLSKPIKKAELDMVIKKIILKNPQVQFSEQKSEKKDFFSQQIPGINMQAISLLFGEDEELAIFAFNSFITNSPNSLEKIRTVSEANLSDYAITIHSIKGITATIGADIVSAKAKKLETMSRAGDLPGVLAENGEFITEFEHLIKNITHFLGKTGS